jgi:UDPglucose 6-dehydrogenase
MVVRRIVVIGAGHVGLTTSACLASLGHRVVCADVNAQKIAQLRHGEVSNLEPGLCELVAEGMATGRLKFVLGAQDAIASNGGDPNGAEEKPVEVVFLCVPTPMAEGGAADLAAVEAVA